MILKYKDYFPSSYIVEKSNRLFIIILRLNRNIYMIITWKRIFRHMSIPTFLPISKGIRSWSSVPHFCYTLYNHNFYDWSIRDPRLARASGRKKRFSFANVEAVFSGSQKKQRAQEPKCERNAVQSIRGIRSCFSKIATAEKARGIMRRGSPRAIGEIVARTVRRFSGDSRILEYVTSASESEGERTSIMQFRRRNVFANYKSPVQVSWASCLKDSAEL